MSEVHKTTSIVFIFYSILSLSILIFYPFWLAIQSTTLRILTFSLLLVFVLLGNYLILFKIKFNKEEFSSNIFKIKGNIALIAVIIFAFLAQILLLFFPLTAYSDEISYVSSGMFLERALSQLTNGHSYLFVIIPLLVLYFIWRYKLVITESVKKRFLLLSILLCICAGVYFYFVSDFFVSYASAYAGKSLAEKSLRLIGGLKSIIFAAPLAAFGYKEFAVRLPAFVAYLLSGIVIYNLCNEFYKSKRMGIYSVIFLLFFPGFFYYGNLALEISILLLASVSSFYFMMTYFRTKRIEYLFYTFIIAALATIFEKKGIFIFGALFIILVVEIILTRKENKSNIKEMLTVFFLSLVLMLPYFGLSSYYFNKEIENVHQSSSIVISNLFSIDKLTLNFSLIEYVTGTALFFIFALGLIYFIYRTKYEKTTHLSILIFFVIYYFGVTVYRFAGLPRFIVPMAFIFALVAAHFLDGLEHRSKWFIIISWIFTAVLVIGTMQIVYKDIDNRYLPMNELFSYITEYTPDDAKFIKSMAPSPYNFYIFKYDLDFNKFDPTIWTPASNQTAKNLHDYMKETNATYVFFPLPNPSYDIFFFKANPSSWLDLWEVANGRIVTVINHTVVEDIYFERTPYFEKVAEFKSGTNTLFLAKIK